MNRPRDGDIYKIIKISNQEFIIKYGYYEEKDRYSKYDEPIPIFPNFIRYPVYDEEGFQFVTHMQDRCKYYEGNLNDDSCFKCKYFRSKEDLIGICICGLNKKK